jgi:two-component system cell cycle response regulator DivK
VPAVAIGRRPHAAFKIGSASDILCEARFILDSLPGFVPCLTRAQKLLIVCAHASEAKSGAVPFWKREQICGGKGGAAPPRNLTQRKLAMAKILLVEDNEPIREMLERRLRRRNYEVVTAGNGAEACTLARSATPDIILLDMHLPVLDGWEAARQLKTAPETRSVPIIALTADAMSGDRDKALQAGCDDYEIKPIDMPRLLEKVQKLLSVRPPGGEASPG